MIMKTWRIILQIYFNVTLLSVSAWGRNHRYRRINPSEKSHKLFIASLNRKFSSLEETIQFNSVS